MKKEFDKMYNKVEDFRIEECRKILENKTEDDQDKSKEFLALAVSFLCQARVIYEKMGGREYAAEQFYFAADQCVDKEGL